VGFASRVTLVLMDTNTTCALVGRDQYLIGREDPDVGIFPDLDLTLSGGEEAGVSRKHAILSYRDGACWLEDQDSTNYTFVNGQRLEPFRAQPLRSGDQLEFGTLRVQFYVE